MKPLRNIDRWIGKSLERISAQIAGGRQPKEALEIRRDILNEIRDRIEPLGEGEYLFPYQQLWVHINAADAPQLETFEAAFLDDGGLEAQVKELLVEAGCKGNLALTVDVKQSQGEPYVIEYRRAPKKGEAVAATSLKRPAAWIHVLKGNTEKNEYFFSKNILYLGRLKEVASRDGSVRRRNDVAFDDAENTISREHAHIEFEDGKFRLFHDSGERPTRLFRDGRAVPVPASGRGAQLRSGDEIHLGEARLRFEVSE
jgi:FHA domain